MKLVLKMNDTRTNSTQDYRYRDSSQAFRQGQAKPTIEFSQQETSEAIIENYFAADNVNSIQN